MNDEAKELPRGRYKIHMSGRPGCDKCKGKHYATIQADTKGASFGSDIIHEPTCSVWFCDICKKHQNECEGHYEEHEDFLKGQR